jgi:excisionase family DNA binding protein
MSTYLTDEEAATLLRIEPRTVALWRKTRGLPHVKLASRVVRIPQAELEAWTRQFGVGLGQVGPARNIGTPQ